MKNPRQIIEKLEALLHADTRGYRLIEAVLAFFFLYLCTVLVGIWAGTGYTVASPGTLGEKAAPREVASYETRSYSVIAEKDLFSPSRRIQVSLQKPKPKPKAPEPPSPPPPPPLRLPPRLVLVGTVLLDDSEAAVIDHLGQRSAYRVGDEIEGFVVKEIRKDSARLEREGEVLRVTMSAGPQSGIQVKQVQAESQPPQYDRPPDIPASLIPRPAFNGRIQGRGFQPIQSR